VTGFYKLMITIRAETSKDLDAIRHVVEMAFGQAGEARLVEALRQADALITSLVAVEEEQIVGHIAFSALAIESHDTTMNTVALAPLAVLPAHQRRGIGSELVRRGIDHCRRAGYGAVLVLGEPAFYQRFGFIKASLHGIRCPFDVPDEAFMAAELFSGALAEHSGTVKYRPEFDLVSG
jgi:putative acetyltransferase